MLQVMARAVNARVDKKGLNGYKALEKELVRIARGQEPSEDVTANRESLVSRLVKLGASMAYRPGE